MQKPRAILVEAEVLSATGGLIGILLAVAIAGILATLLQIPLAFSLLVILSAFIFSAMVGKCLATCPPALSR